MRRAKVNPRSFEFTSGYCTHVGGRAVNEDAWYPAAAAEPGSENPRGRLWAVADGMGGHSGGREASHLACRGLQAFFERPLADRKDQSARALGRHLTETVLRIDRLVRQRAASRESLTHMGTTLSCLLLADGHSIIVHVGDSRIYRWRRGYLTCLTTDHTFVQEMIFEGEVSPEKADVHPLRHLLTQAVGTGEPLDHVAYRMDRICGGDRFLLCTDGLHNVLDAGRLAAVMSLDKDAGRIADDLVATALYQNTTDNVTALVVQLLEKGSA
jgi:protein phosphatase